MTVRQLVGDCREVLRTLPAESVQCVVTSPPYYGLRDYGTDPLVWGSWRGSLGLEPSPEMFLEHLVEIFREVRRVLRPDGVLWVNLGDSYAGSGKGPSNSLSRSNPHSHDAAEAMKVQRIGPQEHTIGIGRVPGYKPKDLMMMPARLAMALQADGWYLRSQIPWVKRNAMPESVSDRPATAVEYVYLLSKSRTYYWDAGAVRESSPTSMQERAHLGKRPISERHRAMQEAGLHGKSETLRVYNRETRNRRNSDWFFESWQGLLADEDGDPLALIVNPQPFRGSHFATFAPKLVEPMILASTRTGDVVLDPFSGAGTVGLVADRLGRDAILIDLKGDYAAMAQQRITADAPLFAEVVA